MATDISRAVDTSPAHLDDSPFSVTGHIPLYGSVPISGSKHSILHILGAVWLLAGRITLKNVPNIWDVHYMLEMYRSLGMSCHLSGSDLQLNIDPTSFLYDERMLNPAAKIRSSILLLGSLLALNRRVKFPAPTGDRIGNRPFAEFFTVLEQFNVSYALHDGYIEARCDRPLSGDKTINLHSHGNNRTALAIILAAANRGRTVLTNPLPQPEVLELCSFLASFVCPIDVERFHDGTVRITIEGRGDIPTPANGTFTVGPDKCEMGFWIAAAVATHGRVECRADSPRFTPTSLGPLAGITRSLLSDFGISLYVQNACTFVVDGQRSLLKPVQLIVPHNKELTTGLCIDACPQFIPLMTYAPGRSLYRDNKYGASRVLTFLSELQKFGLVAALKGDFLEVHGGNDLHGARTSASDIRGAATLLVAALSARGASELNGIFHLNRGYDGMFKKLRQLGAAIERKGEA